MKTTQKVDKQSIKTFYSLYAVQRAENLIEKVQLKSVLIEANESI